MCFQAVSGPFLRSFNPLKNKAFRIDLLYHFFAKNGSFSGNFSFLLYIHGSNCPDILKRFAIRRGQQKTGDLCLR